MALLKWNVSTKSPVEKAIGWLKNYDIGPGMTIPHRSKYGLPLTQETAGFTIPALYKFGEKDFARRLAKWEVSNQRPDGAFTAVDKAPYTFDTAMVIHGFLAVLDDMPELETNLRRACEYVFTHIAADGNVLTETYETWKFPDGSMLSEYGNLYVLPPLLEAGKRLSEPKYIQAVRRSMDYYRQKPDLVEFKPEMSMISHYLGYMMEALVDLGEIELAKKGLKQAFDLQGEDGSIPAFPGVKWICSTGLAQLAIAWYKLGEKEPADKAIKYMETLQNRSGGFYGGYGKGALYFPNKEIAWAAKFFLEAHYLKKKMEKQTKENE